MTKSRKVAKQLTEKGKAALLSTSPEGRMAVSNSGASDRVHVGTANRLVELGLLHPGVYHLTTLGRHTRDLLSGKEKRK